jgi:glycosyltransferase involved in cell wall biosynthesis
MSEARRRIEAGDFARQHLFGCDTLERLGHEVEYGPFGNSPALRTLTRRTRSRLGYLDEEYGMWRRRSPDTVMYAGGPDITRGLAQLRRARLWRTRLASVFHTVQGAGGWARALDLAVCLSDRGRRRLIAEYGRDPARTVALPWGPDLRFQLYEPAGDEIVVSAGRANRDLATLVAALRDARAPARVYAPAESPVEGAADIEIVRFDATNQHWVLSDLARASVIAIPLADPNLLRGLSELNDALGLAKPVIMTRSPEIDVDIEAIGCGRWVEPGDVRGWRAALDELLGDAPLRREMGARGRAWAREHWNSDLFGERLAAALAALV